MKVALGQILAVKKSQIQSKMKRGYYKTFFKKTQRGAKPEKNKRQKTKQLKSATRWKRQAIIRRGFPKRMTMTHTYVENLTLTCVAGAQRDYIWRCNGMYDPNHTGAGHQPLYFDQLTTLYNHYTVIGSKIDITVTQSAQTNPATHVILRVDDDATVPSGTQLSMEQTGAVYRALPAGSPYNVKLSRKWSAKKFFGGSILANTNLSGTAASDPTEQSYYQFSLRPMDGTTETSVHIQVKISYIAVWTEVRDVGSS